MINALQDSVIKVAPRTAELFCGNPLGMPYPEILKDEFEIAPVGYWKEHSNMGHIEYAFSKCELFKLLCYHASPEVEEGIRDFAIFHLKRRNLLAQHVSGIVARQIGWNCADRFNGRVRVDKDEFETYVGWMQEKWDLYDSYPKSIELWFEDGLDRNLSIACESMGIDRPLHSPKTVKVVDTNLRNVIENYDEVGEYDRDYS